MKRLKFGILLLSTLLGTEIVLPNHYPIMIEQLIYFKDDHIKIFYGGPIENGSGVTWMMPVLIENEDHKIRSGYEISFINCLPFSPETKNADIFFIKISDIDIKFQNILSPEYQIFSNLINNKDPEKKCILIREVDISNVYYPQIFIAPIYSDFQNSDKSNLVQFLHSKFHTTCSYKELSSHSNQYHKILSEHDLILEQKIIGMELQGKIQYFHVAHYFLKDDLWKSYYIVSKEPLKPDACFEDASVFLRLDSGCTSGQIYNDQSCDCLEQLHKGLLGLIESKSPALLIHIPTHDGRGFGTAPKGETEIYKQGGLGRVHQTEKLDTVRAATLLYNTSDFDIRTYDGCAKILAMNKIKNVTLLTDNKLKIASLALQGIHVDRKKTNTSKSSCLNHIQAKKETAHYFLD